MANRTLIEAEDGGLIFEEVETTLFEGRITGDNLGEETAQENAPFLLSLDPLDVPKKFSIDYLQSNIHFFISAGPGISATEAGDYLMAIPVGVLESDAVFGAGGTASIILKGVSLSAEIYTGDIVTGSTTIRVSNMKKGEGGAAYIDCTLTNVAADTDRRASAFGTVQIDTTIQALYIIITAVGGHGNINGWIWLSREEGTA